MRDKWQSRAHYRNEMQTTVAMRLRTKRGAGSDGNEWEVFVVLQDNLPRARLASVESKSETNTKLSRQRLSRQDAALQSRRY